MTGTVTWLHGTPDEPHGDAPDGSEEWWSTIEGEQLTAPAASGGEEGTVGDVR